MQYDIYRFTTLESTNSWAKKNLHLFNPKKITLIIANTQTAGRGRYDRKWFSPPNQNLYLSFCYSTKSDSQEFTPSQLLSLSLVKVLEELNFHPALKWPNDIYLSNKKVAGILSELIQHTSETWHIIGLGLNVNLTQEYANQIDQPATSLLIESGKQFDRELLLEAIKKTFSKDLQFFIKEGCSQFIPEYQKRLFHK